MVNVIIVILLTLIKSVCCTVYIDLKFNFISDGVYVHHGTFLLTGNYKMFLGEETPLEKVNFGSQRMFPRKDVFPDVYQLIVEVFDTGFRRFALIHAFLFKKGIQDSVVRKYYELGQSTYLEMDLETFLIEVYDPVYLSMDIGPKHRHPYILRTVIETAIEKKVTFSIVEEFNGMKLDGVHGPTYKLGSIYDSTRPIVVGYTKMGTFINKCTEVTIEHRVQPERVVIKVGRFLFYYDMKTILGNLVWHLTHRPGLAQLEVQIKRAVLTHDKISQSQNNFLVVTLDIAEQLTPELYGIEKTIGTLGHFGYVMYEIKLKYRDQYVIKNVIDMTTEFIEVFTLSKDSDFVTVEVLRSNEKTVVIITSQIKVGMTCIKEVDIFERDNSFYFFYNKVEDQDKGNLLMILQKMYPVRINVVLDDESKAIYDKNEISGPSMTFLHYAIKDYDQRGNDLRSKYIFGVIWEVDPYMCGNINYEPYRTEYRLVKNCINTRKFMIRNTILGPPVDPRTYEIYTVLT